jgi:hypothetical protein
MTLLRSGITTITITELKLIASPTTAIILVSYFLKDFIVLHLFSGQLREVVSFAGYDDNSWIW